MNERPPAPPDRGYYFKFLKSDVLIVRMTLEDNGFRETLNPSQNWTLMWSTSAIKLHIYPQLQKYQKINHFPKSIELTRKDCMYKNMSKMISLYGSRHFTFVPKTFILPEEHRQLAEEMESDLSKYWIVKPSASSQGKGIFVTNNYAEISSKANHIVSRYIDNPLLIDGYKFDLRIYVALTSIHPLRIYVYEEGLVRFATGQYSNELEYNRGNRFVHLTNYSVNKNSENFLPNIDPEKDGIGSKWSLSALKRFFEKNGIEHRIIFEKIEDILIKAILAIEPVVHNQVENHVPFKNNCFELLGFDILLDKFYDPWLLEVNLSPSMNCDSPLDQKIKGDMIADLFTMIGIVPLDIRNYLSNMPNDKFSKQILHYSQGTPGMNRKSLHKNVGYNISFNKNESHISKLELEILRDSEEEFRRLIDIEKEDLKEYFLL